jgi:hypothetical protein
VYEREKLSLGIEMYSVVLTMIHDGRMYLVLNAKKKGNVVFLGWTLARRRKNGLSVRTLFFMIFWLDRLTTADYSSGRTGRPDGSVHGFFLDEDLHGLLLDRGKGHRLIWTYSC